jgi:ureidoacrylate peracid hydrolase
VTESRRVRVDAAPGAFEFEPASTAALVIDMQNDFGATGGMFDRAGIDISAIRRAVAPTAQVLGAARKAGCPVIYLKMGYADDLSDLGAPGSPNRERHLAFSVGQEIEAPDGRKSRILIRDTWNTDVLDELRPRAGDLEIFKTRYSGFYETDLDLILKQRGVTSLVVTGCTTSVCVDATLKDAMFRGYCCLLLADCSAEPLGSDFARTNHQASLLVTETLLGWVSDSTKLIAALNLI